MKAEFPTNDVLATAVAVDRIQCFIRSGQGYTKEDGTVIDDNKTTIMKHLIGDNPVDVTDVDIAKANEIKESFSSSLTFKKLGASLSEFDNAVLGLVPGDTCDTYKVAVAASLPNSLRHTLKREGVKDTLDSLIGQSEVVGTLNKRSQFTLKVLDVTFIKKMDVHMITCLESDKNVVKFWFSKDPDVTGILEGNTITVTGFVKTQSKSKYSNCMETMINRVKIEKIAKNV